MTFRKYLIY